MQVVTSGLPAFLIDTSVNMDYPKTPINVNLPHYFNLENHSTSVSSTSGAKVSSMSRYSVVIPV